MTPLELWTKTVHSTIKVLAQEEIHLLKVETSVGSEEIQDSKDSRHHKREFQEQHQVEDLTQGFYPQSLTHKNLVDQWNATNVAPRPT